MSKYPGNAATPIEFDAPKDPVTTRTYSFDWSDELQESAETITAYDVTEASGEVTISDLTESNGVVSFRVAGGIADSDYELVCLVTTALRINDKRTGVLRVRDR